MQATEKRYDIRSYAKPSKAYADAALLANQLLDEIRSMDGCFDCRHATWMDAERMASLALRLQAIKEQFSS